MSDPEYWPPTIYFPFDHDDWKDLHAVLNSADLPLSVHSPLAAVLDRVQGRADDHFAMVVWSRADIHNAAARLAGDDDLFHGDDVAPEKQVISEQQVDSVISGAAGGVQDMMAERGWDVIEFYVERLLDRASPS